MERNRIRLLLGGGLWTTALLLLALSVSVAVAWWILSSNNSIASGAPNAEVSRAGPSVGRPDASLAPGRSTRAAPKDAERGSAVQPPSAPLPPIGTPLADIIEELDARADAGDAAAACRIAAELSICDGILGTPVEEVERAIAANLARRINAALRELEELDEIARSLELQQRTAEQCSHVPGDWFLRRPYIELRAAQLGDLDAASRFVHGDGMSAGQLLRDPSLAALYRANAWQLFLQLYEAGDLRAVLLWSGGANDERQELLISAVMPEDWRRRGNLASALVGIALRPALDSGTAVASQIPELTPALEAEATEVYLRNFASSARFNEQRVAYASSGHQPATPEACEPSSH